MRPRFSHANPTRPGTLKFNFLDNDRAHTYIDVSSMLFFISLSITRLIIQFVRGKQPILISIWDSYTKVINIYVIVLPSHMVLS